MNLRLMTKKYDKYRMQMIQKKGFPQNRLYSRLDSRVHDESVEVNDDL